MESGRLFGLAKGELKLQEIVFKQENEKGFLSFMLPGQKLGKQRPTKDQPNQRSFFLVKLFAISTMVKKYSETSKLFFAVDETKGIIYQHIQYRRSLSVMGSKKKQKILVYQVKGVEGKFTLNLKILVDDLLRRLSGIAYSQNNVIKNLTDLQIIGIAALRGPDSVDSDLRVFFENESWADIKIIRYEVADELRVSYEHPERVLGSNLSGEYLISNYHSSIKDYALRHFLKNKQRVSQNLPNPRPNKESETLNNLSKTLVNDSKQNTLNWFIFGRQYVCTREKGVPKDFYNPFFFYEIEETIDNLVIRPSLVLPVETPLALIPLVSEISPNPYKLFPPNPETLAEWPRTTLKVGNSYFEDTNIKFINSKPSLQQVFFEPFEFFLLTDTHCRQMISLRPVDHTFTQLCFIDFFNSEKRNSFLNNYLIVEPLTYNQFIEVGTNLMQIIIQKDEKYYVSIPFLLELAHITNIVSESIALLIRETAKYVPQHILEAPQEALRFMSGPEAVGEDCYFTITSNNNIDKYASIALSKLTHQADSQSNLTIYEEALNTYFTKLIIPIYNYRLFAEHPVFEQLVVPNFSIHELHAIWFRVNQFLAYLKNSFLSNDISLNRSRERLFWRNSFRDIVQRALQLLQIAMYIIQDEWAFESFMQTPKKSIVLQSFKEHLVPNFKTDEVWNQVLCEFLARSAESKERELIETSNLSLFFKAPNQTYVSVLENFRKLTLALQGIELSKQPEENIPIFKPAALLLDETAVNQKGSSASYVNLPFVAKPIEGALKSDLANQSTIASLAMQQKSFIPGPLVPQLRGENEELSNETEKLLNICHSLTLTNIENLLIYYVSLRKLSEYFRLLREKIMSLKRQKEYEKQPAKKAELEEYIDSFRELIIYLLLEMHQRFESYSQMHLLMEKTKNVLASARLISKAVEIKIDKFFGQLFGLKQKTKIKHKGTENLSYYAFKELQETFDICLSEALNIEDRNLNLSIFMFLISEKLLYRLKTLTKFNSESILMYFKELFKSPESAQYFSHLILKDWFDPKIQYELYYQLANYKSPEGKKLSVTDQLTYFEKAFEVVNFNGEIAANDWEKMKIEIVQLRLVVLAVEEFKLVTELGLKKLKKENDLPENFRSAKAFEDYLELNRRNSKELLSAFSKLELNFSIWVRNFIANTFENETNSLDFDKVAIQFSKDDEQKFPQNFISFFDIFFKMDLEISVKTWVPIVQSLILGSCLNSIYNIVLDNLLDFRLLAKSKFENSKVPLFESLPNLSNFDLFWVNSWLIHQVKLPYETALQVYFEVFTNQAQNVKDLHDLAYCMLSVLHFLNEGNKRFEGLLNYPSEVVHNFQTLRKEIVPWSQNFYSINSILDLTKIVGFRVQTQLKNTRIINLILEYFEMVKSLTQKLQVKVKAEGWNSNDKIWE